MKKFIAGVICGAMITIPVSALASSQIAASIFPCKVTINNEGQAISLSAAESPFLLHNDRTYVPIRALTEAIGYQVDFEGASGANNNLNQINLYKKQSTVTESSVIQDKGQVVSISVTEKEFTKDINNTVRISGTITVNKDVSGKSVIFANSFAIENELFQPLEKGQTRNFSASMEGDNLNNYTPKIVSREWGAATKYDTGVVGLSGGQLDLDFIFFGANGDKTSLSNKPYSNEYISIRNKTGKSIDVKNADLHYQIIKIENGKETVICDYVLPKGIGALPAGTQKEIQLPAWDYKTADGKTVLPGNYKVKLSASKDLEYVFTGESKINKMAVKGNIFNEETAFTIVK